MRVLGIVALGIALTGCAASREEVVARPDGTVEWSGYIFDGWGNVLGG